jgi:4-amino-4-deoxy-L-arabinose transferase-like glycosyltransferase
MIIGFINSSKGRFSVIIFLVIVVEAVLLVTSSQGPVHIQGGDGPGYHQIALNMLEHFSFSLSLTTPIEPTIYRTPGYSTFLAAIYLVSGYSFLAVKIAQLTLLGLTAYWLYGLALRFVDERTAKLSALLCATYPPLVFLTTFHLTEILATCVTVGLILLIEKQIRSSDQNSILNFAIGLTSGTLALIRPSLSLSIAPILMAIAIANLPFKKIAALQIQKALLQLTIIILGVVLVLSPWLIRNAVLSHKLILSPTGPESLLCSMLQYKGMISYALTLKEWQEVYFPEIYWKGQEEVDKKINSIEFSSKDSSSHIPRSVQKELLLNEFWQRRASEEFRQLTFIQITKSLPKRLAYLWSTCDMAPLSLLGGIFHRFVQGHFILLFLLAISGILLRWKNFGKEWILWIFPIYVTLAHLFFHIEPRYSMPARPFILIYSAAGFIWLSDFIKQKIVVTKPLLPGSSVLTSGEEQK